MTTGTLELTIEKAKLIRDTDFFGTMDPYCQFKYGD